ncbi:hypothetical protein AZE42_10735 [Rhizopogon vesiculosus]|uniref:Uncharacterized protein n=1 Tax=Rhizopogon vesiculosus TaxID=180088 RepID=A0A1J8RDI4_9AGAM|nr:hypothetical protein AZE42_10735 [Rhizopogon vesiculosus]
MFEARGFSSGFVRVRMSKFCENQLKANIQTSERTGHILGALRIKINASEVLVLALEFLNDVVHEAAVKVLTIQVGITGGSLELKDTTLLNSQEGDTEGSSTEIENEDIPLAVGSSYDSWNRRKAMDVIAALRTLSEVVRERYAVAVTIVNIFEALKLKPSVKLQPKVTHPFTIK